MSLLIRNFSRHGSGAAPPTTTPIASQAGTTSLYYGDSITAGQLATSNNGWCSRLQTMVGATNNGNAGVPGQHLCDVSPCNTNIFNIAGMQSKGAYKYIYFAWGANDVMNNNDLKTTPTLFEARLNQCVDAAIARGWALSEIVILTPYYINDAVAFTAAQTVYWQDGSHGEECKSNATPATVSRLEAFVQAAVNVATSRHTVLANVYQAMKAVSDPVSLMAPDGIHPNDAGHQLIAEYLYGMDYTPR